MSQYIVYSAETLTKLKVLADGLQWEQNAIARLAVAAGFRLYTHQDVANHVPGKLSGSYLHDAQLDPEQNQIRIFKLLVEHREGRRLDQVDANDWLIKYLDLGVSRLHDAWEGRDEDKYKFFAFLRDLVTSTIVPDTLSALVSSAPQILLGTDQQGKPIRFCPNQEGGHRNAAHLAIAGTTGVGKTQVSLALIDQTLRQSPQTGCLILDYKGDISKSQGTLLKELGFVVYEAGRQALPLNPLFLPSDVHPGIAAQSLTQRLSDIQRLGPVQMHLIRESAHELFEEREAQVPTLAAFREKLLAKYEASGKGGKPDTAIGLLSDIAEFNLFQGETGLDPTTFLSKRIVIDFSSTEAFRDLVAFFLLNYINNGMKLLGDAPVHQGPDGNRYREMRTLIFIDEAHHYLSAKANPVYDIVRVARSFGVALWLSTQSLTDFQSDNDELTTNLSTWLLFKPGSNPTPANKLQGYLSLDKKGAEAIANDLPRLGNGECYANVDGTPKRVQAVQLYDKATWQNLG